MVRMAQTFRVTPLDHINILAEFHLTTPLLVGAIGIKKQPKKWILRTAGNCGFKQTFQHPRKIMRLIMASIFLN